MASSLVRKICREVDILEVKVSVEVNDLAVKVEAEDYDFLAFFNFPR